MASHTTNVFSCVRCSQRKVKCDKLNPCSNCVKSKVECIFRVAQPPRRRKKVFSEGTLLARLKRYEDLLKNHGIAVEAVQDLPATIALTEPSPPQQHHTDTIPNVNGQTTFLQYQSDQAGQLLVDRGKSRFIENNLWVSASTEFQPGEAIIEQYSDDEDEVGSLDEANTEFTFGHAQSSGSIRRLHPASDHVLLLWQIFLENVDPLTKLLHRPTLEDSIMRATSDVDSISNGFEALLFSIYNAAVTSMDQDNCEIKFGEPRKTLLSRYRYATRKALTRARFMATSDIQVLQAFTLYLLLTREVYDSRTMWALAGVARRLAQGMGMHRDGTTLGVSPFEAEMRRRLWWQISILDFRSAELCGSAKYHDFTSSNVRSPGNFDDNDIHPTMEELPKSQERATEMIACLLRCEFGCFWRQKYIEGANGSLGNTQVSSPNAAGVEGKNAMINDLERQIEEKYLRYCDPTIPIQFMTVIIGRTAIGSMRLVTHCEKRFARLEDIPSTERDRIWNICINMIESDNLVHSTRVLRRFAWHNTVHFQWQALIYLLYELRHQTLGIKVDKAWTMVDELFAHHSNFITDNRKPLHAAVGNLCVKAYHAREVALHQKTHGMFPQRIPGYIAHLRKNQKQSESPKALEAQFGRESTGIVQSNAEQFSSHNLPESVIDQSKVDDVSGRLRSTVSHPLTSLSVETTDQTQYTPTDQFMFGSEPGLAQDLAMAGISMDWMHWDDMIQGHGYEM